MENPAFLIEHINWETDGEKVKLPKELLVLVSELDIKDINNDYEVEEAINNYLSDNYGWLVNNYLYQLIDYNKEELL